MAASSEGGAECAAVANLRRLSALLNDMWGADKVYKILAYGSKVIMICCQACGIRRHTTRCAHHLATPPPPTTHHR